MSFQAPGDLQMILSTEEYNSLVQLAEYAKQHIDGDSIKNIVANANQESLPQPISHDTPCQVPESFDGGRLKLKKFRSHLKLYFLAKPKMFPNENSKILFTASLLTGEAFDWIQALMETHERLQNFSCFNDFCESLKIQFGGTNTKDLAEKEMLSIRQTSSVSEYANRFKILKAQIDWNDSALLCHFYRGLKDRVKD